MHDLPFDDIRYELMESWIGNHHDELPLENYLVVVEMCMGTRHSTAQYEILSSANRHRF